jgi:DNA-binding GntR family transcriptional regulator
MSTTESLRIVRRSVLRSQVVDQLRDLIITGVLEPKRALVERELAESLGVSRTPVREALMELQREGLVRTKAKRGLLVSPLLASDVHEIFPLLASLERFALNELHSVEQATLDKLEQVNDTMALHLQDAVRLTDLDSVWHQTLFESVRIERVIEFMNVLRQQARRYAIPHMQLVGRGERSIAEHSELIALLRTGSIQDTSVRLERHWQDGASPLLEFMQSTRS